MKEKIDAWFQPRKKYFLFVLLLLGVVLTAALPSPFVKWSAVLFLTGIATGYSVTSGIVDEVAERYFQEPPPAEVPDYVDPYLSSKEDMSHDSAEEEEDDDGNVAEFPVDKVSS